MNIIERLENFKLQNQDHPDIVYLKQTNIGGIVNRGLSDLYKTQPKNPITFLANWLLNESRSNLIKERIEEDKKTKKDLKEIYLEKIEKEQKEQKQKEEIAKNESKQKIAFLEKIKNSKDIENDLNFYCQELQRFSGATGVYISVLDRKRKEVSEDDDERAHLSNEIVIRYVNFCEDHNFLKNKHIENGEGITYDLFKPKEENAEANLENSDITGEDLDAEGAVRIRPEKEYIPNHLLIDEVVRNPKMKFFREPKLGCYLAVDLSYKSSLSTVSLDSSIAVLNEFNTRLADYELRKKEFYDRLNEENAQRENQDNSEGQLGEQYVEQVFPNENIVIAEFEKTEKKYILCLDTVGQDRIFTDEERKFIFEVQKTIKENWEILEKKLLIKDRDAKLELEVKENSYRESGYMERLESEEERFIKDYFAENIIAAGEKEREIETLLLKSKFILHTLFDDEVLCEMILEISKKEVKFFNKFYMNFYFLSLYILSLYIYVYMSFI